MNNFFGKQIFERQKAVVIDFGSSFIKCGFAGEGIPQAFLPTNLIDLQTGEQLEITSKNNTSQKKIQIWKRTLFKRFYSIFFDILNVNPKSRKVVFCENILLPNFIKEMIIEILFEKFHVVSLLCVPSPVLALVPFKKHVGLVIDLGHSESTVVPVYQEIPLYSKIEYCSLAFDSVVKSLRSISLNELKETNKEVHSIAEKLPETIWKEIAAKTCFVLEQSPLILKKENKEKKKKEFIADINYPCLDNEGNDTSITISGKARSNAAEILFNGNSQNDYEGIPYRILECLMSCNSDITIALSQNLILTGGTSMVPGCRLRLENEINWLLENDPHFKKLKGLQGKLIFQKHPFFNNYLSWIGGSVFGYLEIMNEKFVSLQTFKQMGLKSIPNWSHFKIEQDN
ncbi:actin-related protein [Anaeramoeba flamelloides]|uniref:Actin-related protein n=1 Tax=Anaeramoeba flamelloides TaxID=1746091 RepID=A0ABQ8X2Q5_9EUKA|nr:actin-related protein [Anaeramoeba flamelloides]